MWNFQIGDIVLDHTYTYGLKKSRQITNITSVFLWNETKIFDSKWKLCIISHENSLQISDYFQIARKINFIALGKIENFSGDNGFRFISHWKLTPESGFVIQIALQIALQILLNRKFSFRWISLHITLKVYFKSIF